MNWKRHNLGTHFAGGYLNKTNSVYSRFIRNGILACLGEKVECPILSLDTFSDGVYYHNQLECFVKFEGVWYKYECAKMFTYYQDQLNVSEIDMKDRDAIVGICKTKYASIQQFEMMEHICQLSYLKNMKLDFYKDKKKFNLRNKK